MKLSVNLIMQDIIQVLRGWIHRSIEETEIDPLTERDKRIKAGRKVRERRKKGK